MGIYDREYYRREGPSFLGSFTERGPMCRWLILINVIVFVIQMLTPRAFTEFFAVSVPGVFSGQVWQLLTYAFLHDTGSAWHIIMNMLGLWFLGTEVEDLYGGREFLATYLLSAFLGGVAYVVTVATGMMPGGYCVGASGAVYTVLILAALHYPNRQIYLIIIPVRLWLIAVIWVGLDAFTFLWVLRSTAGFEAGYAETRTAVQVHLAGAAFGFLYYKFQWRVLGWWEDIRSWFSIRRFRSRPRLRVYREEESSTPVALAPAGPKLEIDEHLEAQVDAVLEKVSRHGQASLTDSEREILFRASEVYKKRKS